MKIVGLVIRPSFTKGTEEARRLLTFLEAKGLSVRMPPHLAEALERSELSCPLDKMSADVVMTLGGDGTLLYTARSIPPGVPLLPVNFLSFGFLAEGEIEEATKLLEEILAGEYEVQETLRLATWLRNSRLPDATNEVSLFPDKYGRPLPFQVQVGDSSPFNFRGDGLVVATPYGSTGHALSLGGPILNPELDVMLVLAAAPLRRSLFPLVIPGSSVLHIRTEKPSRLIIDGVSQTKISPTTDVTIRKSESPLRVLRRSGSFYRRLKNKLLRW